MSRLFLSPHFDDETLFGSFTILADPSIDVAVCFVPENISEQTTRIKETTAALSILGCTGFSVMSFLDPIYEKKGTIARVKDRLEILDSERWYDTVFAPEDQYGGNEDHNQLSLAADSVFRGRIVNYCTYTWPGGKSRTDNSVCFNNSWLGIKHRALACHESQILRPETASHFGADLWEYYA